MCNAAIGWDCTLLKSSGLYVSSSVRIGRLGSEDKTTSCLNQSNWLAEDEKPVDMTPFGLIYWTMPFCHFAISICTTEIKSNGRKQSSTSARIAEVHSLKTIHFHRQQTFASGKVADRIRGKYAEIERSFLKISKQMSTPNVNTVNTWKDRRVVEIRICWPKITPCRSRKIWI